MTLRSKIFSSLLLSILLIGEVGASGWNRWSIGGGGGRIYPQDPEPFRTSVDDGILWTAFLQYVASHDLAVIGSYNNIRLEEEGSGRRFDFQPYILSVKYQPLYSRPVSPYLKAGAGVSNNRRELAGGDSEYWNKFAAQGGAGVEVFLNRGFSLSVEGLYHYIRGEGGATGIDEYEAASALALVNVYLGEDDKTKKAREEADRIREERERLAREAALSKSQAIAAQNAASEALEEKTEAEVERAKAEMEAQQKALEAERARAQAESAQSQLVQRSTSAPSTVTLRTAQAELDVINNRVTQKESKPITFQPGSALLLGASYATLDQVADVARKHPHLKLRVETHTDELGDEATNTRLSQQRAEAIRSYLISKGVLEQNITAVGMGSSQPAGSDINVPSVEGQEQDQRVEFNFVM